MKIKLLLIMAPLTLAAASSFGTVYFQDNGTKEGWSNYPQTPEAKGTITDVTSPTYHSTSSIKFTQTFVSGYTGRYHSEVDDGTAQQSGQDRYYGMTVYIPSTWQSASDQVNIQQWAGSGPWILMRIDGTDLLVDFDHLSDLDGEPHLEAMPKGQWVRIVTRINSTSSGTFQVTVNGSVKLTESGKNFVAPGNGGTIRWSTGCYVSGWYQQSKPQVPSERIVYGTHYRIASTESEAEPANW